MKCELKYLCLVIFYFLAIEFFAQENEQKHAIYISTMGWHTGIVIPGHSLTESLWWEGHDYKNVPYLEIGWGEADFYSHDKFNFWYALKSIFWPTSSVLHINPIHGKIEDFYLNTNVVKIEVDKTQLAAISTYITEEFLTNKNGEVIPFTESKYSSSYFYKGRCPYYFPENSNVWVARAIKSAGFDIRPIWHQTTGSVLNKAEKFGELVITKK